MPLGTKTGDLIHSARVSHYNRHYILSGAGSFSFSFSFSSEGVPSPLESTMGLGEEWRRRKRLAVNYLLRSGAGFCANNTTVTVSTL